MSDKRSEEILSVRNLDTGYMKRKDRICIVRDINMSSQKGEITSILGPNGSGKTTFIYTVAGLLKRLGGSIELNGKDTDSLTGNEIARNMAVLLTKRPDTEWMTVRDMVEAGRYPYTGRLGILKGEDEEIVDGILDEFELTGMEDKYFYKLSDGQKQRVMIARALCQQPKLLILDEPTGFLDIRYKYDISELIIKLAAEKNIAVILSVHELDIAKRISDKVLCFKNGVVEYYGEADMAFEKEHIRELFDLSSYDGTEK
ncbi:MAG: ABC transporter ATP-binding protein [Lachnospiraceae bacterium]|nr:ABC transporter ATP-binding protein [Lachnospiraceae bacterium]